MLRGLLSVRGKAHPVDLLIEEARPAGRDLHLRASVRLDRYDFGITKARGLAARHLGWPAGHRRPPALSRAVTGCREAVK